MLLVDGCVENLKALEVGARAQESEGNRPQAALAFGELAQLLASCHMFAQAVEMHEKSAELYFELEWFAQRAERLRAAADLADMMGNIRLCADLLKEAAVGYDKAAKQEQDEVTKARYERSAMEMRRRSACGYGTKRLYWRAGTLFRDAAVLRAPQRQDSDAWDTLVQNRVDAVVAFAYAGAEADAEKAYELLNDLLQAGRPWSRNRPGSEKMIQACQINGFDRLASKIFVDKMNREVQACSNWSQRCWMRLWGFTSEFGENWPRFLAVTLLCIVAFAVVYFFCPLWAQDDWRLPRLDYDAKEFRDIGMPYARLHNFAMAMSFSITVFATLGFGNIHPDNAFACLVVGIETLCGYAFLGLFVTMIARRFSPKP